MAWTKRLEKTARTILPPSAARLAKRAAVYPRYWAQRRACKRGFRDFGDRYPQKVLFVAGLPKSGTTWLERMLSSYPGFHDLLIPDVAAHEVRIRDAGGGGGGGGGSHDYELPADMFGRFRNMLVLTKMHVHGSEHNARVLRDAGVRYVVLFRDLRDVAVSNFFYVRNTPWHPEFSFYDGKSVDDGLVTFARRTLPAYVQWVRSWDSNRDPRGSIELRYEDMLADPEGSLRRIAELFQLDSSDATIRRITDENSFSRMSGGRARGQADTGAFVRKGVAGDWKNHFSPRVTAAFKEAMGDFLVEYGYEPDASWQGNAA